MKAIVFGRYGPPTVLRIEDRPKPVPRDDEILVRVYAATVATADFEIRSFTFTPWLWLLVRLTFGMFRPKKKIQILGQEIAGRVEKVGPAVTRFKPGDDVFAPLERFGGHAEYLVLKQSDPVAHKPENVSFAEAASTTVFALNALYFIDLSEIKPGEHILINGAGGSIGTVAVQLAKHLGAQVTAVDSEDKLDMLRKIGAHHVIDFNQKDFTQGEETYDIILDVIGKSHYGRSLECLSANGRLVIANPKLAPMLRGVWTSKTSDKKVLYRFASYKQEALNRLRDLLAEEIIKPIIDRTYPFDEIVDAHTYVETGQKKGHVVLTICDE